MKSKPKKPATRKTTSRRSFSAGTRATPPRSKAETDAPVSSAESPPRYYEPDAIEDAPEFHTLARALGTMTRGTWEPDERSPEERIQDFLFAYPPHRPVGWSGGRLRKQPDGSFAPGDADSRLSRFMAKSWAHGSLHELLSRFGLRMKNRPDVQNHLVLLDPVRDVAKRRNVRLRVLHGGVDVEPVNMDAAKAEYLDHQEKQQAARDVRAARARMQRELDEAKAVEE